MEGEVKKFFGHVFGENPEEKMEGWQQFVVHAVDERGDGISDYMIEVLTQRPDGTWDEFKDMYTDVTAVWTRFRAAAAVSMSGSPPPQRCFCG